MAAIAGNLLTGAERFSRRQPTPVADPAGHVNHPLATLLGIAPQCLESPEGTAVLAGYAIVPGSEPIATVYAGHQFRQL